MKSKLIALVMGSLVSLAPLARAQQPAQTAADTQFQRGFYLQVHGHDLAGAAAAYRAVLADAQAPAPLRQDAQRRLTEVEEDRAAVSFARLMPEDCLAYAELAEPGQHIGRILKAMDLLGHSQDVQAGGDKPAGQADGKPLPLGEGFVLPTDFTISPALVAELGKIRGVAAGVTAVDNNGRPSGLAVVHPGDCDLLRGAIETAVQLLEPAERIGGFKTYRIPEIGWVLLSARMVFVSDSREQLAAAVERLHNPQATGLAGSPSFRRAAADAKGALVFAFVDGPKAVKRFSPMFGGQQAAIVRALLDPEHLESLTVALTTTDSGVQLRARLSLASGHKNMLYALIRTAPITKRSLAHVPQGAAGVLLVGLNPAGAADAVAKPADGPPVLSAMDIGREFFNNIEELSVFALSPADASAGRARFPEVGAVIAVKDADKSEALWNQVLSLAALAGQRQSKPSAEIVLEGKAGRTYQFDGIPAIAVVRTGRELVIGTEPAVAAALKASANGNSIARDAAFGDLVSRLTPTTSKALLVDVGRAVELASALSGERSSGDLQQIGTLVHDMKFSILTDEAPNQLTVTAEVTGLPKFRDIVTLLRAQSRRGRVVGVRD